MSTNTVSWTRLCTAAMWTVASFLAAGEPWRVVEQPELKQALEKAPVLQTESLGEPARGVNVWERGSVAVKEPSAAQDGSRPGPAGIQQGAAVTSFCFGRPSSVTRTGFIKVTVQDAFTLAKGYGFQSVQGLQSYDRGGSEIKVPVTKRALAVRQDRENEASI